MQPMLFSQRVVLRKMSDENESKIPRKPSSEETRGRVKFEVYGEEMVKKTVKLSGNSGRVYLPPDWVGCQVKIIRVE